MREGLQELTKDNRGEFASEFVRGSIQTQFSSQRIQVAGAGKAARYFQSRRMKVHSGESNLQKRHPRRKAHNKLAGCSGALG